MKSVADELAREQARETFKLSASERVALALALGDQAVDWFASANHVTRDEARRILRRNNQIGRRPSAVASDGGE